MKIALQLIALACALFFPTTLYADAQKSEWFGSWQMNHDGHVGTLVITDSRVDCATTPWCDMVLSYTGNGQSFSGKIVTIGDRWQHIAFEISFPGNQQKFDGYIFSGNKNIIAGTTYWGGRTFGFYATKKKPPPPEGATATEKRVGGPQTLKELRELASRLKPELLLGDRSNKPYFSLSSTSFSYYEGDPVSLTNAFGYTDRTANPYLIPLERLIVIDDLRQFLSKHPEAEPAFWDPYFKIAEAIIEQKMLPLISRGGDPRVIGEQLKVQESTLSALFKDKAPNDFARAKGLVRKRPGMIAFLKHVVPVTFTIDPPGQIFVVAETSYEIAIACGNEIPWRDISGTSPQLGGYYWIRVRWADNASRDSRILVDRTNTAFNITR